jgi:hypothetical protein
MWSAVIAANPFKKKKKNNVSPSLASILTKSSNIEPSSHLIQQSPYLTPASGEVWTCRLFETKYTMRNVSVVYILCRFSYISIHRYLVFTGMPLPSRRTRNGRNNGRWCAPSWSSSGQDPCQVHRRRGHCYLVLVSQYLSEEGLGLSRVGAPSCVYSSR